MSTRIGMSQFLRLGLRRFKAKKHKVNSKGRQGVLRVESTLG